MFGSKRWVAGQDVSPAYALGQTVENVGDEHPCALGAKLAVTHLRVADQELSPIGHNLGPLCYIVCPGCNNLSRILPFNVAFRNGSADFRLRITNFQTATRSREESSIPFARLFA